jgi:hypothetical protein
MIKTIVRRKPRAFGVLTIFLLLAQVLALTGLVPKVAVAADYSNTVKVSASLAFSDLSPKVGQPLTATYVVQNTGATQVTVDLGLADRADSGKWNSFTSMKNVVIPANGKATFSGTKTVSALGNHTHLSNTHLPSPNIVLMDIHLAWFASLRAPQL